MTAEQYRTMAQTIRLTDVSDLTTRIERCERLAGPWNSPVFDFYMEQRRHLVLCLDAAQAEIRRLLEIADEEPFEVSA